MVQPFSMPIRRWRSPRALQSLWLPAALTALTLTVQVQAQAQAAAPNSRPDPLDPQASIPTLRYQSSFAAYRRLDDGQLISWRDANDTVSRIGGWRVYAREAQQPDPAAAAAPSASAPVASPARPAAAPKSDAMVKPMPAGHGDHKRP
jgi:hypothetical protein